MKKYSILIIGGTGFLGYHLIKKCKKLKLSILSISKNKPLKYRKVKNIKYKVLDLSKKKNLKTLEKFDFKYVVNLGGYIEHNNTNRVYRNHYLNVRNIYSLLKNKKIYSFVQAGSSAEYANSPSPQKEIIKIKPKSIYGYSKYLATKFLIGTYSRYNFPVTILRFYQVYGPNQNIDRFIPLVIKTCINNTTLPSSHGKQMRDFLYVSDAVEAIVRAMKNKSAIGKIINIGSGKPKRLIDIIKHTQKKLKGGKFILGQIKLRTDEPNIIYPDLNLAKKILKWKAKVKFTDGLKKTVLFYKKYLMR